jgi:N-methylhydantoinase B
MTLIETPTSTGFDGVLTAVLANRLDSVVREMTNTLLRSARSAVINSARDFSCAIVSAEDELIACAEGLPCHIYGAQLQTRQLRKRHPEMKKGDAFLDNNPYTGNSHAADHAILVPVFFEGEHLFTAYAKAHQADIGNSLPTTYHAAAKDVYEEGALIFPCVQVQRNYENIDDILEMCYARIRVPSQWYGDYLAAVGAARTAELRLEQMCQKYGLETIKDFMRNWLDYSEQRMRNEIAKFPHRTLTNTARHDAFEGLLPDGVDLRCSITIDPENEMIEVDLRDNPDNLDCGLNLTEATTMASVFAGLFNAMSTTVPMNSGAFRRVNVLLKEGGAVGIPKFPHSCSLATTNLADRTINMIGSAFAQFGSPYGVSEAAIGMGASMAVLSGKDPRYGNEPFVNQVFVPVNGGPASAHADGWVTFGLPAIQGLMYRDSIEIDEVKMPIHYRYMSILKDSGGAGEFRGGPGLDMAYEAKGTEVTVIYPCDGQETPARGVLGGLDGQCAAAWLVDTDGSETLLPNVTNIVLQPGQAIRGVDGSAGGYGNPFDRRPEAVLADVIEYWVSPEKALQVYGVKVISNENGFSIDHMETTRLRSQ